MGGWGRFPGDCHVAAGAGPTLRSQRNFSHAGKALSRLRAHGRRAHAHRPGVGVPGRLAWGWWAVGRYSRPHAGRGAAGARSRSIRLPGFSSRLPLLKVEPAGFGAERSLGVGDAVAVAVVAEQGVGLPPGPPAAHAGWWLAQLPGPAGPFQLRRSGMDAATPGQHPGEFSILGDGVGLRSSQPSRRCCACLAWRSRSAARSACWRASLAAVSAKASCSRAWVNSRRWSSRPEPWPGSTRRRWAASTAAMASANPCSASWRCVGGVGRQPLAHVGYLTGLAFCSTPFARHRHLASVTWRPQSEGLSWTETETKHALIRRASVSARCTAGSGLEWIAATARSGLAPSSAAPPRAARW